MYDKYFTVEFKGPKGWEVEGTFDNLDDAVNKFKDGLRMLPLYAVRLTSPTDYGR